MTKTITLPSWQICVVETSASFHEHVLYYFIGTDNRLYGAMGQVDADVLEDPLPAGQWEIVGITPLTEEQAGEVVEYMTVQDNWGPDTLLYLNYPENNYVCKTALQSFASLQTAHGVDVSKRWLVLKRKIWT